MTDSVTQSLFRPVAILVFLPASWKLSHDRDHPLTWTSTTSHEPYDQDHDERDQGNHQNGSEEHHEPSHLHHVMHIGYLLLCGRRLKESVSR
jgi:hypothetical protein